MAPRYDEFDDLDDDFRRRPQDLEYVRQEGQARLGILSFISAGLAGLLIAISFLAIIVMTVHARGQVNERSPGAMLAGCGFIAALVLALVGGILGIVGFATERQRGHIFTFIGVSINAVLVLGVLALMCVGLAAHH